MIALLLLTLALPVGVSLVPDTEDTWTDGRIVWEGNPFCVEANVFPGHVQVVTNDGQTIWADSIGACRNPRPVITAGVKPKAPSVLKLVP